MPSGGRVDFHDALVPGLSLRVTAAGHRSFVLIARYPSHPKHPTRRALGDYGEITLEKARETARDWLALIRKGVDPKVEEARQRAATQRQQVNSFSYVAEEFLTRHAGKLAHGDKARRIIQAEFVRPWGARPITDITPEECAAAIRAVVKRGAPSQAHSAHEWLRRLYNWAIGTSEFGITASPVAALRPSDLIDRKVLRDRTLTDHELRAVWQACSGPAGVEGLKEARRRDQARTKDMQLGYPYGPLVKLMILTGQRESEIAGMSWAEIDFAQELWTIPASRMKSDRSHQVPLAPEALALLKSLPRFPAGNCVFSTTDGRKPVNGFSKCKERIDRASGVADDWVFHDLRRTMRTHLSALPIEDRVREQMIAHAQPGLHRVYDQHKYASEKLRGFELWEARLKGIVSPVPDNVRVLRGHRPALEAAS